MNNEQWNDTALRLSQDIKMTSPKIQTLADEFRAGPPIDIAHDCHDLQIHAIGNLLIKARLIVDNNFQILETIGLLATSRYLLELSIWARLLEKNDMYGLVCVVQQMEKQIKYYKDYVKQLENESDYLERSGTRASGKKRKNSHTNDDMFCVYGIEASEFGASSVGRWIRSEPLAIAKASLTEVMKTYDDYLVKASDSQKIFIKNIGRWQWKRMAIVAGMLDEYEFVYTFSSKLIHANPASFLTNQKNLEIEEMCLFLRFAKMKLDHIYFSGCNIRDSRVRSSETYGLDEDPLPTRH